MKRNNILTGAAVLSVIVMTVSGFNVHASEQEAENNLYLLEEEGKLQGEDKDLYYTDDDFDRFYENEKKFIMGESEESSQTSLFTLFRLALYGGMTKDQLERVLNDGILVDNMDELKEAGVLDKDFSPSIKDGTKTYSYKENKKTVEYKDLDFPQDDPVTEHNFETLSDEAEMALINSTVDLYPGNTYIKVKDSGNKKSLNGQVINAATINGCTDIHVDFTDDTYKVTKYRWYPTGWITSTAGSYNLGIEYDESHIHFDEQKSLPRKAGVVIKMEKPNTKYNVFYSNGSLLDTYVSDKNGYITLVIKDATDYKVTTGSLPFSGIKEKLEDVKTAWDSTDFNEPSVLIVVILVAVILIAAAIMLIKGIRRLKRK